MINYAIVYVLITSIIGGLYFKYSQTTIANLEKNNAELNLANEISNNTIDSLKEDVTRANKVIKSTNEKLAKIRKQNQLLIQKQNKHNLTELSIKKPKLVEKVINNATENVNRCFEILSGSPLTDKELSATTDKEFNSECPFLRKLQ